MRLVFWQNCLSPHQIPYIVKLAGDPRVDKVVFVTDKTVSDERKKMGWGEDFFPGLRETTEVYIDPSIQTIDFLLASRTEDSVHLFSGIRGFAFVFSVLKRSLRYRLKRGIIVEQPNTFFHGIENAKPLWLHKLRYVLQDKRYISSIDYVFAMGSTAVSFFQSLNRRWRVFPFAYCTDSNDSMRAVDVSDKLRICFVGGLESRKNVMLLLQAASQIGNIMGGEINLYGDGPERQNLKLFVSSANLKNVTFCGMKKREEVSACMSGNDLLVLPSFHDGWGAVVNEALHQGLYVLCSDHCGAKDLLWDDRVGKVFRSGDVDELAACILSCAKNKDIVVRDRSYRQEWAQKHIGGEAIAKYMEDCLTGLNSPAPWHSLD